MIVTLRTHPEWGCLLDTHVVRDRRGTRWFEGTMHDVIRVDFPHRTTQIDYYSLFHNGPISGYGTSRRSI